jgi:hypothetical protein
MVLAVTLASSSALAQFDTHSRNTGLEGSFHIGYGTFTNSARFCVSGTMCGSGPLDGSVGLEFLVGYRIVPAITAGVHFGYQFLSRSAALNGFNASGAATGLGVYAQLHLIELLPAVSGPLARLDVAVGLGFDFYTHGWLWVGSSPNNVTTDASGVAVPFMLTADFAVVDFLSVGILAIAAPAAVYNECSTTTLGAFSSTTCDGRGRDAEGYFFIGAGVRGHYNLFH